MQPRYFVIGADDPEMRCMVGILNARHEMIIEAKVNGSRVHPSNAYDGNNANEIVGTGSDIITIECAVSGVVPTKVIDHHRPGDPGYGLGPDRFWEASSLGQLCRYLKIADVPHGFRVMAAMDHCYGAAMEGLCPGVTPEEVHDLKVREIARKRGVSTDYVIRQIQAYVDVLNDNAGTPIPTVVIGDQEVACIPDTGIGYTLEYLCAQVAAIMAGKPVLIRVRDRENAPYRRHLCGKVNRETIDHFLDKWVPEQGLVKPYGNPERGYAGAKEPAT